MDRPKSQLTLRELNFAKTRYKILQTFLGLNMKKDYDNITVDEICDAAEISRGTFFNYFPTKEHIYTYYGWWFCARLFVELNKIKYKECSSYEKIKFIFDFTVKEDNKYNNQMPLFISHILRRDMNIIKEVEYTKADYIYQFPNNEALISDSSKINLPTVGELLINLLEEGIGKKEFRADIDIKKAVFHLLSVYFSPYIIYKFLRQECPLEEVYTALLDDIIEPMRNKE